MQVETASKIMVQVGRDSRGYPIRIQIRLEDKGKGPVLSITGDCWNYRRRDIDWGGQSQDHIMSDIAKFEVPRETVQEIVDVWNRWHLNDLKAGCEHQRAEKWDERPIDPAKPTNHYGKHFPGQRQDSWNMLAWVRRDEHPEGLLMMPCPTCGYKYGSAWLREEIPADVLAKINGWLDPKSWNPKQVLNGEAS